MFQKKTKLGDEAEPGADSVSSPEEKIESRVKPITSTSSVRTYGVDNTLRPRGSLYGQNSEEKKEGSKLHVGADIHLKGEITSCDRLIVEGKVEASMKSKEIEIAKTGVFSGKVDIDTADISGCFDGTMKARKRLVVRKTGRVTGDISYGEIEIEPGGEIGGTLGRITGEQGNLLSDMEKEQTAEKDSMETRSSKKKDEASDAAQTASA